MSFSASLSPQDSIPPIPLQRKENVIVVTPDAPNVVQVAPSPQVVSAINHGILAVQESLGRRVKLRLEFETRVRWRNCYGYKRMRSAAVLISAPTAEQAQLFLEAIHEFAKSLDGKWLAPQPPQTTESK